MSEWKLKSLKDLSVSITSGLTPLKNNSEYWDNPVIPWLKTDQLGEKYIWDTNTKISEIALEKTSLKLYPPKTLSIAMYGEGKTRGNISIIMKPMATNQACCNIIINDEKADFEYVYYYMKTQYESLRGLSSGVRNNLNANDIKNYEIRIPESIVEQNNISKVLSVLDQKIAINNQINEELEAMAKTLYDYWFVQFDFPDENGKPYKSSGGKMVYNEQLKREIPEGWGVEKVSEIAKTGSGGTPKSTTDEYYSNGTIPWINSGELNKSIIISTTNYITEFGLENSSAKLFPADSILIAMYGATAGKVSFLAFESSTNQAICAVTLDDNRLKYYFKFFIEDLYSHLVTLSSGSARDNLSQDMIKNLLMINPNDRVIETFFVLVDSYFLQITNNLKQNQELTQLRDWLLPMLMNGQVRME